MTYCGPGTSEKVVEHSHFMSEEHQAVNQVRPDKTSATGD